MQYIHTETGVVKSKSEWKAFHSNTSFPKEWGEDLLVSLSLARVHSVAPPRNDDYLKEVVFDSVRYNEENQRYEDVWIVRDRYSTEDEKEQIHATEKSTLIATFTARQKKELAATDWVVVKAQETGAAIPEKYSVYRSALRAITSHRDWPFLDEGDWPTL